MTDDPNAPQHPDSPKGQPANRAEFPGGQQPGYGQQPGTRAQPQSQSQPQPQAEAEPQPQPQAEAEPHAQAQAQAQPQPQPKLAAGQGGGPYRPQSDEEPRSAQYPPTGRRRIAWWILSAIAIVALAIATWGGFSLIGKFTGARNSEAAVENYLDSAASFQLVDTALGTAPSERAIVEDAVLQLADAQLGKASEEGQVEIPAILESLAGLEDAVDIRRDGFEYQREELVDGVEVVTITEGVITIDGDEQALEEGLTDLVRGIRYEAEIASGASADEALELALEVTESGLDIELPYELDIAASSDQLSAGSAGIEIVTVKEGDGWYISQIMTGVHLSAIGLGTSLTGIEGWEIGDDVIEAQPAESPEAAGLQLTNGILNAFGMSSGSGEIDPELGIGILTEAERTLASLYLYPLLEGSAADSNASGDAVAEQIEIDGGFAQIEYGGVTMILPDQLEVSYQGEVGIALDGYCGTISSSESECLTDWPVFAELGWDRLGIVVVEEDGGWLVSPYQTVEIFLETATERYLELRSEGNLDVLYR